MHDLKGLCEKLSTELHILQDAEEREEEWINRLVYSSISRLALSEIWNNNGGGISVKSFRNSIANNMECYKQLFPCVLANSKFESTIAVLSNCIYERYKTLGLFYHYRYNIVPPMYSRVNVENISLLKGFSPVESVYLSGSGPYVINTELCEGNEVCIHENPQMVVSVLVNGANWQTNMIYDDSFEYLKLSPPFNCGYWTSTIDNKYKYSLMRKKGLAGEKALYYLLKKQGDALMAAELPGWVIEDRSYTIISNGLLQYYNTMPPIRFRARTSLIDMKIGYRLPPLLEALVLTYSWPKSFNGEIQVFNRTISAEIYPALKNILMDQGYQIVEV
jgi:hypothetical protein